MMNASQIYTNDTLATSRKPAAKSALKKITPPNCKNLRILILCISILFTLSGCEKLDIESSSSSDITSSTKTVVTQESLLGNWLILSAVVPVGSSPLTADIAWEGTMMEITEDSVRFHRHDLVYPATYPGEIIDNTLISYPATYSPDGHITINGFPFALFPQEDGTIIMHGNDIEITILKIEN
ncbi:MAG: hypothetical protein MR724_02995 [Prevotella sp.]|nr:hypothetical protein [Prevotella sp.]